MSRGRNIPGRDRSRWRTQGSAAFGRVRRKLADGTRTVAGAETAVPAAPGAAGTSGPAGGRTGSGPSGMRDGRTGIGGAGGRDS